MDDKYQVTTLPVKTLNLTVEYAFQLEALYLTLDIFTLLARGSG